MRGDEEVKLFDGFYVNESVRICEKCSLISNIPIVKRPTPSQLKTSEKASFNMKKRLRILAGLDKKEEEDKTLAQEIKKFQENPELEKPEDLVFKLVDNFHWIIQTERRRKGLYLRQLAQSIGESESAIKMLEKGIVPNNALELIQKIEQFLKIKLVKKDYYDKIISENVRAFGTKHVMPISPPVILKTTSLFGGSKMRIDARDMKKEEADDMVKQAIMTEKNKAVVAKEKIEGIPLRTESFRKERTGIGLAEFKKIEDNASRSFEIENMKTRAEIAREQFEDFGREERNMGKKISWGQPASGASEVVAEKIRTGKTPTIYELFRLKEEKNKKMSGKEILIENPELEPKKPFAEEAVETAEVKEEKKKKGLIASLKSIFDMEDEVKVDIKTGKLIE